MDRNRCHLEHRTRARHLARQEGGYAAATTVLWDITKGVSATASNVDVAFRIESNEPATLAFETRETTSGHPPQLVLTTTGTSPSPSPSQTPTSTPKPTPTPSPTSSSTPPPGTGDIVLGGVGDTNPSGTTSTTSASGLNATSIKGANVNAWAHLGDHQYTYGDCNTLVNQFDKAGWGAIWNKALNVSGPTHDWSSGHRPR